MPRVRMTLVEHHVGTGGEVAHLAQKQRPGHENARVRTVGLYE